tara:strand:- start:77 stop:277 length:201 start_codon:yes stop_codon:yes gene_type:complete
MSLTVNDLNTQHNNKTRNIAEVNVPRIVDSITHTYEQRDVQSLVEVGRKSEGPLHALRLSASFLCH